MGWKEVGKKIVQIGAPLLGTAVGGPFGPGIGALVAAAFGADPDNPEEILRKIQMDPDALIKLREIETRHKERLEEIQLAKARLEAEREISSIREVNQTMRVEAQSEHWAQWGWRPFWGFVSGTAFFVVCGFVCYLGYKAIVLKDGTAFGQIPLVIGSFTTLFGIPGAILGIAAWGRNILKAGREQTQHGGA